MNSASDTINRRNTDLKTSYILFKQSEIYIACNNSLI